MSPLARRLHTVSVMEREQDSPALMPASDPEEQILGTLDLADEESAAELLARLHLLLTQAA
jgi:hypothetical protein